MASEDLQSFASRVSELSASTNAYEATDAVFQALKHTAATSFFWVLRRPTAKGDSTDLRYLIGCAPSWGQEYVNRHWHLNDPFLNHCLVSNQPLRSGQVFARTPGQRDILRAAEKSGFCSCLAIPMHGANPNHKGMLLLGSDQSFVPGERALTAQSGLLRAIAAGLFDWSLAQLRAEAISDYQIDDREQEIFKLLSDGTSTNDVAAHLGISTASLYKTFQKLNSKLTTSRITDAVEWARLNALV